MSVSRKPLLQRKKPQDKDLGFRIRDIPKGVRLENLKDAIVDGAWTCGKGDEVIVSRRQNGKLTSAMHTVGTDDKDYIELWDEKYHKWFVFKVAEAIKVGMSVKVLRRQATVSSSPEETLPRADCSASSTEDCTEAASQDSTCALSAGLSSSDDVTAVS